MQTTHRSPARALIAAAAATASLGLAFGTASASDTTEPAPDSTVGDETTESVVDDPRVGLSFSHPAEWELSGVRIDAAEGADIVDPCDETLRFSLGAEDDSDEWHGISVEMVPVDCEADNGQIGNGFHGLYRSIDDVVQPYGVEEVDNSVGSAVVFTQEYYECTNECNDFTEHLAIVTLDDPADDRYPSVVIRDNANLIDEDEFTALVEGLGRIDTETVTTTEA